MMKVDISVGKHAKGGIIIVIIGPAIPGYQRATERYNNNQSQEVDN